MKRIFSLIGAILLILLYVSTLLFALIGSPVAMGLLKASVAATILIPVILYSFSLMYKLTRKKSGDDSKKKDLEK